MKGASFRLRKRPHARHRRRIGLGQDDARPRAAAPARAERRPGRRPGDLRRPRPARAAARRAAADPAPHPGRVPEPVRVAQPALHGRADAGRADDDPRHRRRRRRARRARARALLAKVGLDDERARQVPARVLRRPAPAHRDRALPDARPRGAGARRGGERARRVGAGAGAQPAEGPAGRARASPTSSSATTSRSCASWPTRCW